MGFVIQDDEPAKHLKDVYQDIPIEKFDAVCAIVSKTEKFCCKRSNPNYIFLSLVRSTLGNYIYRRIAGLFVSTTKKL